MSNKSGNYFPKDKLIKDKLSKEQVLQIQLLDPIFRDDDFIFSYWLGGGGYFVIIYDRAGEIFVRIIRGMLEEVKSHFPATRGEVGAITKFINLLQFGEAPCFVKFKDLSYEDKLIISNQYLIMHTTIEQEEKKRADALKLNRALAGRPVETIGQIEQEQVVEELKIEGTPENERKSNVVNIPQSPSGKSG